jgi:cbb3-type cytochrome oxidase maturation protein
MNVVFILLPIAIVLGGVFLVLFLLAAKGGQFDDLDDPPKRILKD